MSITCASLHFTADNAATMAEWFEFNFDAGCSLAQMRETLRAAGYVETEIDAFIAVQHLRVTQRAGGAWSDAAPLGADERALDRFWRRTEALNTSNRVLVGDREVRVLARNAALGIYYLGDFLSDAECAAMIGHAGGKLAKSTVVDDDATGFVVSDRRSSEGAMFMRGENDTARAIERRIARLTDLPVDFGEGLQVLHYGPGGEYRPHFDYFNPDTEGGKANLHRHGQRLVTVVMYLADVTNGGGTLFPELSLEFAATRGAALMFASAARDGSLLKTSLHAGCPVIAGEKWIATKWIRPFPYEGRAA